MISKRLYLAMLILNLIACGTFVGNPKRPTEEGTPDTSTNLIDLPVVEVALPKGIAPDEQALLLTGELNLLEHSGRRVDKALKQVNQLIKKLNKEKFAKKGKFKGKGGGKYSGYLEEIAGDDDFIFQFLLCQGSEIALHLKWNASKNHLFWMRNFGVQDDDEKDSVPMITSVDLKKLDTEVNAEFRHQGRPWNKPGEVADGWMMSEILEIKQTSDGVTNMKSISDWYQDLPENGSFEGDSYVVGRSNASGDGEFIGYFNLDRGSCSGDFKEEESLNPGWCMGKNLKDGSRYGVLERVAAWQKMKDFGLIKKERLERLSFAAGLTCPAD